ncbi:MAG: hypothetical protein JOZ39_04840 [Chloroflexi bacterium]|nr:hypothetical protein [Chloroflexota bacterium]
MPEERVPPVAGAPEHDEPGFNPYDTDPYDPLAHPASGHKPPLLRDDASNDNPQARPGDPPGDERPGRSA